VYAYQVAEAEAMEAVVGLVNSMALDHQNRCHGVLLCSRELLEKHVSGGLPWPENECLAFEQALQHYGHGIQCYGAPAVQCAFLNIVNDYIALRRRAANPFLTWCAYSLDWREQMSSLGKAKGQVSFRRPFESQLRTSLGLNRCLLILLGVHGRSGNLARTFQEVAADDLDSALSIFQGVQCHGSFDQHALWLLLDLCTLVISDYDDETVVSTAMYGLSSSLEAALARDNDIALPTMAKASALLTRFKGLAYNGSRDFFNATMRGLGTVFTHKLRERPMLSDDGTLSAVLDLWITMLRSAAVDMTEAPTRLNAAESLHCFRHSLAKSRDRGLVNGEVKLYSILYDGLNDDEEEIREVAASTTSFILTSASGGERLQLCPVAACHRFSAYQAECFAKTHDFHLGALGRLMFPVPLVMEDLGSFTMMASQHSVQQQLDLCQRVSYQLFEEERQNLYVDEIREIEIWRSALGKVSRTWINEKLVVLVENWALKGLQQLTAAMPNINGGPFGMVSKREMVTLFVRVIRLAELCVHWEISSDFGSKPQQTPVHQHEMERLLTVSREFSMHSRAQKVLEDSVRNGRRVLDSSRRNLRR
jgi:hypothetical protein